VAIPDSEYSWYEPVQVGNLKIIKSYLDRRGSTHPDSKLVTDTPGRAYQPYAPDGSEWPAWLALARLDINSETAVAGFCSHYGLLGLRKIREWEKQHPLSAPPRLVRSFFEREHSQWYDAPAPKIKPANWHNWKLHCEPLELFISAAEKYQNAIIRLTDIDERRSALKTANPQDAEEIKYELGDIATVAQSESGLLLLDGCRPCPVYDKEEARWFLGWQTDSLLDACYLSLALTTTMRDHAGLKRCAYCNKPFLAATENDAYCSINHRKRGTVAKIASRQVRSTLRDMLKAGKISKKAWRLAHAETDRLYKNGIKDKEQLQAAVEAFLREINDAN
jgi:hypothetical protein